MVMGVHDVFERFARPQFFDLGEHGARTRFVLRRLDQGKVIVEFHQHAVMRLAGQIPDTFGDFFGSDHRRRKVRRGRGLGRIGRRQVADVAVHGIFGHLDVGGREFIGF